MLQTVGNLKKTKVLPIYNGYLERTFYAENFALGGRFRNLTNPVMFWYNGHTYMFGYKSNIYNNQVYAVKFNGTDIPDVYTVGTGTTSSEPSNHASPMGLKDDSDYIYMLQNSFHVAPFRVWKSNSIEDVSAFTQLANFGIDYSYLGLLKQNNTDCVFVTRKGDDNDSEGYNQTICKVDINNPSAWTDLTITDPVYDTNNVRHYPMEPWKYGTSTKTFWGIILRKDTVVKHFGMAVFVSTDADDFEVIRNYDNTFNKDCSIIETGTTDGTTANKLIDSTQNFLTTVEVGSIVHNTTDTTRTKVTAIDSDTTLTLADDIFISGENYTINNIISVSELETNFTVIGTNTDVTKDYSAGYGIQIDDDFYLLYKSTEVTHRYSIRKFTYGVTATSTYELPPTDFYEYTNGDNGIYMYYNGSNIVITASCKDGSGGQEARVYTLETDLTGWAYVRNIETQDALYLGLPVNLDEVVGNYTITGRSKTGIAAGLVRYALTNDKYNS